MNATLVAYYGEKPAVLVGLIESIQRLLAKLGRAFVPYPAPQVHATLIGLEGFRLPDSDGIVNENFLELRAERRVAHLGRVFDLVRRSSLLPFTIQIGGFEADGDYSFASRGQHPFVRSFSFQGSTAVAMGWPRAAGTFPTTLGRLRVELESEGVLHKYHASPETLDNDFFFVLGRVLVADTSDAALRDVDDEIRELMARDAVEFIVDVGSLQVVCYVDPSLPLDTSVRFALADADPSYVATLYANRDAPRL